MTSAQRGTPTSGAEVTNVSPTGIWVLIDQREFFLSFADFPWFAKATIGEVTRLQRPSVHHLYWPDLDVDLAVESLEHPALYPLVSRARPDKRSRLPASAARVREIATKGAEYNFRKGRRGKYEKPSASGTTVVRLEQDVAEAFPTASAVNSALRKIIRPKPQRPKR